MLISEYFGLISQLFASYSSAGFLLSSNIVCDTRSDEAGYIRGVLNFVDETALHFREYIWMRETQVEKVSYAYHYQTARGDLIFRYDNALHRPNLERLDHKHRGKGVVLVDDVPSLEDVLLEITSQFSRDGEGA
jgi:hypothetical protein